ncbi:creatininase family protein [Candidatus Bathyarchaeota archaeon]|nr:creatininase family protein [Candidatus Bathyarchaeota archaeon]
MKTRLNEMSWVEAREYLVENDTVVLPLGSTEQHGPHAPLGTDSFIAKAWAEEAAKRARVLCLPTVPFGVSSEHKQFWGTIWVSSDTFKNYVKELCLALNYYGVKKIVVINGHGGNLNALSEIARDLREKSIFLSIVHWWYISRNLLPDLFKPEERRHACSEETSIVLALYPQNVKMNKSVDELPRKHLAHAVGITLPLDLVDQTLSGVFGKSTTASVGKGEKVLETVTDELSKYLVFLKKMRIDDLEKKQRV